jgi:ribosomal protein S18 acetylase RimI-like enzyme
VEITARRLSDEEWIPAADIAARAMQSVFEEMLGPDPLVRLSFFYRTYRELGTAGAVVVGVLADGFLMGLARAARDCPCEEAWDPGPGVTPRQRDALRAYDRFTAEHHPSEPHWWVAPVAVEPLVQGRGLGSIAMRELMSEVTREVGEDSALVLLEAEEGNVGLYERAGFREIERAAGPDGVVLAFMESRVAGSR